MTSEALKLQYISSFDAVTAHAGGGGGFNVGRQYRHVCRGVNGLNR